VLIKISLVILFYVITNNSNITIPIPVNSNFTTEKLGGLFKKGFPTPQGQKNGVKFTPKSLGSQISLCVMV
jgi:hypothetical protein